MIHWHALGVGAPRGKFLKPGDGVRVEIDGLGAIEHPVVAAQLSQETADG